MTASNSCIVHYIEILKYLLYVVFNLTNKLKMYSVPSLFIALILHCRQEIQGSILEPLP